MSSEITPNDFSEIRWRGHWIWVEPPTQNRFPFGLGHEGGSAPEARGLVPQDLHPGSGAGARPGAHHRRFALCAVRQRAGGLRGPIRSQPRRLTYDLLRSGALSEARREHHRRLRSVYGRPRSFCMPAAAGHGGWAGRGVLVFEANLGADGWLVSDATWKAIKSDAWGGWKNPAEMHPLCGGDPDGSGRRAPLPVGWERPGFDDSAWGAAQLVSAGGSAGSGGRSQPPTDPYGPLHPRPIAQLGGESAHGDIRAPSIWQAKSDAPSGDPVKRLQQTLTCLTSSVATSGRLTAARGGRRPAGGCARHAGHGRRRHGPGAVRGEAPAGTVLDISTSKIRWLRTAQACSWDAHRHPLHRPRGG